MNYREKSLTQRRKNAEDAERRIKVSLNLIFSLKEILMIIRWAIKQRLCELCTFASLKTLNEGMKGDFLNIPHCLVHAYCAPASADNAAI